jgi:hypothetical protein
MAAGAVSGLRDAANLMRGLITALILAALLWLVSGVVRRFMRGKDRQPDKALAKAPERQ